MDRYVRGCWCLCVLMTIVSSSLSSFSADFDYDNDLFDEFEIGHRTMVGYVEEEKLIHLEIISLLKGQKPKLTAKLGLNVHKQDALPPSVTFQPHTTSFEWQQSGTTLQISRHPTSSHCHVIKWTSAHALEDCLLIGAASWYGGPEHSKQLWPVEKLQLKELPYVPQHVNNVGKTEPYWFNSEGISVYVNASVPLFVDVRNHKSDGLCFIADDRAPYLPRAEKLLQYTLCSFDDPRQAHQYSVANFFERPAALPDRRMVEFPVWSTWVRYKKTVNQSAVLDFARQIVSHGFNNSQLEIDDNWETCYGSGAFNRSRFEDTKDLIRQLKEMGFRTTLWTHPFVNKDCPDYQLLKDKGYFVKNEKQEVEIQWWDGRGGVVDLTKRSAAEWFATKHRTLRDDLALDGFKFDAGEVDWLPQIPQLNCSVDLQPRCYSQSYAATLAEFGPITELRVSFRNQQYPIFVRMLDKDSKWSWANGLRTLITTLLVQNMHGYPFVLPDMVAGNAYGQDHVDKELFIRWLQATCFMPVIQFSVAPFDFDNETVEISKKVTALHYKYSKVILDLMEQSVETGAPVNPPIWWVDPQNTIAHRINDEYMLGEDLLLAPVLRKGATQRNIYLPLGYWREENHERRVFKGRRWLRNYRADLATLPYFTRVKGYTLSSQQKRTLHYHAMYQLFIV